LITIAGLSVVSVAASGPPRAARHRRRYDRPSQAAQQSTRPGPATENRYELLKRD
jgi:hypothetical protein